MSFSSSDDDIQLRLRTIRPDSEDEPTLTKRRKVSTPSQPYAPPAPPLKSSTFLRRHAPIVGRVRVSTPRPSNTLSTAKAQNPTPEKLPTKSKVEQKPKKPNFSSSHELVALIVGKEPNIKKLVLHKEAACLYSPVFTAAFNSAFLEGQTQEYRLEEVNEGAAQFLVQWLYNQELTITQLEDGKYNQDEVESLIQLNILADKLLLPRLQNLTLSELSKVCHKSKFAHSFNFHYLYANTGPGSPLRRFVVDHCASVLCSYDYGASSDNFPKEMLVDLAAVLSRSLTPSAIDKLKPEHALTRYHVPEA
ncbi:hypothetical protein LAWI1_G006726 [Lachnellula willkommii]|uniref:BTB domain-containing protein n=1 Tax=Lachnellula willkommii TaxID=215461 RepID=A0A559M599_9HELO|nr:hypothetical protein LAWI1_G006726 [Lachnellula willkommii]